MASTTSTKYHVAEITAESKYEKVKLVCTLGLAHEPDTAACIAVRGVADKAFHLSS